LKNKKALSPVVAAIILIAVTVAVSIAAATWMGSISFSFMKVDELKVSSHTWASGNIYIDLVLKNLGTTTITISEVQVDDVTVTTVSFPSGNATLGAGDTAILRVIHSFTSAAKHEFTIITASGTKCVYIASASSTVSQIDWVGDGSDGPLDVSSANQIVNNYAFLTGNENAGETTITVSGTSGFSVDDEILLIQIQNSSGGEAGTYEFKHISSIMGNDITLTSSLDNNYYSGSFDSVDATASQIVRVPQYTSVTIDSGSSITAPAWDGYTGGIVVFRAETVTINNGGSIDVSEKGYRGGAYGPSNNLDGYQGESYLGKGIGGSSTYGVGKMNNAGAGGSYICGGGGEYGGGATNSDPWTGSGDTYARKGEVYGTADLTKIFFGSGGGGQWNGNDPNPSDGGDGGGIIIIYANLIVAPTDSFLAIGETTNGIQQGSYTYGSSGGAGGAIFLYATTIQGETNFCRATGGSGNHLPERDGGDGGVGRIRLDYVTLDGTTTPSPGYTGSVS